MIVQTAMIHLATRNQTLSLEWIDMYQKLGRRIVSGSILALAMSTTVFGRGPTDPSSVDQSVGPVVPKYESQPLRMATAQANPMADFREELRRRRNGDEAQPANSTVDDTPYDLFGVTIGMSGDQAMSILNQKSKPDIYYQDCIEEMVEKRRGTLANRAKGSCMRSAVSGVESENDVTAYDVSFWEDFENPMNDYVVRMVKYSQYWKGARLDFNVSAMLEEKYGPPNKVSKGANVSTTIWPEKKTPFGTSTLQLQERGKSYTIMMRSLTETPVSRDARVEQYIKSQLASVSPPDF